MSKLMASQRHLKVHGDDKAITRFTRFQNRHVDQLEDFIQGRNPQLNYPSSHNHGSVENGMSPILGFPFI